MKTVEFRVRPVTRFVVTRYTRDDDGGDIATLGEFDNEGYANEVVKCMTEVHLAFKARTEAAEAMRREPTQDHRTMAQQIADYRELSDKWFQEMEAALLSVASKDVILEIESRRPAMPNLVLADIERQLKQ